MRLSWIRPGGIRRASRGNPPDMTPPPRVAAPPESPAAPPGFRMPLSSARPGDRVEVVAVRGGAGLQSRLADMGLGPGARFRVETRGTPGPFLIELKGARLILGRGMVERIWVRPAPTERAGP